MGEARALLAEETPVDRVIWRSHPPEAMFAARRRWTPPSPRGRVLSPAANVDPGPVRPVVSDARTAPAVQRAAAIMPVAVVFPAGEAGSTIPRIRANLAWAGGQGPLGGAGG